MSYLPDELWLKILEIGIITKDCLTYKDLCCVSISSLSLHRLSCENSLWNYLLSSDFSPPSPPSPPSASASSKSLYKFRFERELRAHRWVLLRKYSDVHQHYRRLQYIHELVSEKIANAIQILFELSNLPRVRQQYAVLEMKLEFCNQHIATLETHRRDRKRKLDAAREELELLSMKYHPMHLCDWRGK